MIFNPPPWLGGGGLIEIACFVKITAMLNKIILIMSLYTVSSWCKAQVSIAPTGIMLDERGHGTVYIGNTSNQIQEVRIQFQFGYPGQDSLGEIKMIYGDTIREKTHGLGNSLKAYPSAFTLKPQSQQMVRLILRERNFKEAGLYFSRIKISSQTAVPEAGITDSSVVGTRVAFRFEQYLPVFYQQGQPQPLLTVAPQSLQSDYRHGSLLFDYQCSNHTPYLGQLRYRLISEPVISPTSVQIEPASVNEKITAWKEMEIALYFNGNRRCLMAWPETLGSGKHCLELEFQRGRRDFPTLGTGKSPDYRGRLRFELP
jgi:P pilus assembly chaperone PapD